MMTFREMMKYESGLADLERRIKAIAWFSRSIREGAFEDFEGIEGLTQNPQLLELCYASLEIKFTESLLLLVGPSGMHPKLKSPECYALAHQHLWKNFPKCQHAGPCFPDRIIEGEMVTVDFTEAPTP